MSNLNSQKAYYHLPGLFEFFDFYSAFLPLYFEHPEYFYDWCEIGSIYGAPSDYIWGGGRIELSDISSKDVLDLLTKYRIPARLTFSNSLLREEHLSDTKCNRICSEFSDANNGANGVIVHSDLLANYLKTNYPDLYLISSTTKVLTNFNDLVSELNREEFKYVVPDFRLNKSLDELNSLSKDQKDKVEFLCNECCFYGCMDRKKCYEAVSLKSLGEETTEHHCKAPFGNEGYKFSRAMENLGFISVSDIKNIYLPMGFSNFKIEGRGLGSALILEFILHYMTKPEYMIHVRENLYLDTMLDLF